MSVYTKNVWTDNQTPVDKAHMDVIENGVFASQFRDEKGVANGYASLDANAKVPVAQLPISYGTTLPASPVDGQEAILVDSLTNPTYQWRFRYNAGSSSAYKWEFVGGAPARSDVFASETTTSTSFVDLTTVHALTAPRAGEYLWQISCSFSCTSAGQLGQISVTGGSGASSNAAAHVPGVSLAAALAAAGNITTVSAGLVLKLQFLITAGTGTFSRRSFWLTPARVS